MGSNSESCREIKCDKGRRGLQGPRPSALRVSNSSSTMIKKSSRNNNIIRNRSNKVNNPPPVVIYLRSPKIIHVRPEEFMSLVQRLTGKDSTNGSCNNPSSSSPSASPLPSCSRDMQNVGDDESTKSMTKRDDLFDADQILGLSPTCLRFLACV